jgi:hypothetical protein
MTTHPTNSVPQRDGAQPSTPFLTLEELQILSTDQRANKMTFNHGDEAYPLGTTTPILLTEQEAPTTAPAKVRQPRPKLKTRFKASELDLMELPELATIVPGLLPAGLCMLVAKPKIGKSFLSMNLSSAVARGDEFFGQNLEQGDALYLVLEDNHQRVKSRLKLMLADGPLPDRLEFWLDATCISQEMLEEFEAWVSSVPNPRLIIIDPLARVMPEKKSGASDYEASTQTLALLQKFAFAHDLCILIVHHSKKNAGEGNDVFDLALGSIGINGVMDAILVIERERDNREATLNVTGRDFEERRITIMFDQEHGRWTLGENEVLARVPSEQLVVLKALHEGHRTPGSLAKAAGKKDKNVQNMLSKLVRRGLVSKVRTGEYALTPVAQKAFQGGDPGGSSDPAATTALQEPLSGTEPARDSGVTMSDSDASLEDELEDEILPRNLF